MIWRYLPIGRGGSVTPGKARCLKYLISLPLVVKLLLVQRVRAEAELQNRHGGGVEPDG